MSILRSAKCLLFCALASWAGAQNTFVLHFDSVQLGRPGTINGIKETPSGYLVTGLQISTDSTSLVHNFIRTIDHQGQVTGEREWWPGLPYRTEVAANDPICTYDDSTFAGGLVWFDPNEPYRQKVQFVRFDHFGDTLNTRTLWATDPADSVYLITRQMRALIGGGFALVGAYYRSPGVYRNLILKLDVDGDTLWSRLVGSTGTYEATGVAAYDDGLVYCGTSTSSGPLNRNFISRMDSSGMELWNQNFGEKGVGNVVVRVAPDGSIYTWSRYKEDGWSPIFAAVLDLRKWTPSGTLVWSKRTQLIAQEMAANDLEILPDGGFIGVADHLGVVGLMRYDANGDSLWLRRHWAFDTPGGYSTYAYDVERTSDGGFIFCGWGEQGNTDPTPNLQTWFVIKTDSMGCVVPGCQYTGLSDNLFGLENALTAFPNPSAGDFTLELDLPANAPITGDLLLQVFDMQGRQVVARGLGRDRYQRIALDLTNEPAGLYSAFLSDGRRILTGVRLVRE